MLSDSLHTLSAFSSFLSLLFALRSYALYGFEPPRFYEHTGVFGRVKTKVNRDKRQARSNVMEDDDRQPLNADEDSESDGFPKKFGNSTMFTDSIPVAEFQGRPLADHKSVMNGRPPGSLLKPRPPLEANTVAESIAVISCWYYFSIYANYSIYAN